MSDSKYLGSDAVFGVRNSLVVEFKVQPPGAAPDGRLMASGCYTVQYDFRLVPAA